MKRCSWCGKPVNKYKDSICKECAKLVEKGKFDMMRYFKRPSILEGLERGEKHGSK